MAFNIFFKKGRLIWDEYIPATLPSSAIKPKISFDKGYSWMSLGTQAENLRDGNSLYGGKITKLDNGYNQIDITFTFTPTAVPKIVDYELEEDVVNGLDPGTYYFAVGCINYDTPGLLDGDSNNYYATGYFSEPISKLVEVTISVASKVHLYVNYPDYTRGLCVYYGQNNAGTIELKLYHVTNLVNALASNITSDSTETIILKNQFPLPNNGIIKIENEYIAYTTCSWNTDHWELTNLTRGVYNTTPTSHNNPVGEYLPIYLAMYKGGGLYGEIPKKEYAKPEVDASLVQYLNFDTDSPKDLVDPNLTITEVGNVNYSSTWTMLSKSLRLTGVGYLTSNYNLNSVADSGSIHFYISFESFVDNETEDPYIFGSADGLWMRINRINNKPYFGFSDVTIIGPEDYRVPSLTKGSYDRIGLAWRIGTNNTMIFDFTINGYRFITEETDIPSYSSGELNKFEPGIPNIGGTSLSNPNTSFKGYIDDWRIYNKNLTLDEFNAIHEYLLSKPNVYCGKVTIDKNYFDLSGANVALNNYEPLIDVAINTTVDGGQDFGIYYDDWLVEKMMTSGVISSGERLTYPIEADTIQIGFDLTGNATGSETPIIKNISLIISEDILG